MDITGYSPRSPRRRCGGCTAVEIRGISVAVKLSKLPRVLYRGVALEYHIRHRARPPRGVKGDSGAISGVSLIKADVRRYSIDDIA